MGQIKFTEEHEWIRMEGLEGVVGITDYAQKQLGDIVFADLPEMGHCVEKGEELAVLDSVKAAGEIYAPMTGIVVAVNEALIQNPALINTDPLGEGWIVRLRLTDASEEMEALMDADAYAEYVVTLA